MLRFYLIKLFGGVMGQVSPSSSSPKFPKSQRMQFSDLKWYQQIPTAVVVGLAAIVTLGYKYDASLKFMLKKFSKQSNFPTNEKIIGIAERAKITPKNITPKPKENTAEEPLKFLDRHFKSMKMEISEPTSPLEKESEAIFEAVSRALGKSEDELKLQFVNRLNNFDNEGTLSSLRDEFSEVDDITLKNMLKGEVDTESLEPQEKQALDNARAEILSVVTRKKITVHQINVNDKTPELLIMGKTPELLIMEEANSKIQILSGVRKVPLVNGKKEHGALLAALAKEYTSETDRKMGDLNIPEFARDPTNNEALQLAYLDIQENPLPDGIVFFEVPYWKFEKIVKGEEFEKNAEVIDDVRQKVIDFTLTVIPDAYALWKFKAEISKFIDNPDNNEDLQKIYGTIYKEEKFPDFEGFKGMLKGLVDESITVDDQDRLDTALINLVEKMVVKRGKDSKGELAVQGSDDTNTFNYKDVRAERKIIARKNLYIAPRLLVKKQ